jgi:hypothetical protein
MRGRIRIGKLLPFAAKSQQVQVGRHFALLRGSGCENLHATVR